MDCREKDLLVGEQTTAEDGCLRVVAWEKEGGPGSTPTEAVRLLETSSPSPSWCLPLMKVAFGAEGHGMPYLVVVMSGGMWNILEVRVLPNPSPPQLKYCEYKLQ